MDEALKAHFLEVVKVVQARVKTVGEIVDSTRYFFSDEITWDEKAVRKHLHKEYVPELFRLLIEELEPLEPFSAGQIEPIFDRLCEQFQLKRADVMQPVRVAVTGGPVSPGMYETLELLGKEKTLQRLRLVLERLRQGEM